MKILATVETKQPLSPYESIQKTLSGKAHTYGLLAFLLLALYIWGKANGKGGVLGKGGLGKDDVLDRARRKGLKEMGTSLGNTPIWLGDPSTKDCVFLRTALPGIIVEGGPGSGKTYSVFNGAMLSVVQQNLGCIIIDFKYPKQTSRIVDYAKNRLGYQVGILAPTFPESQTVNPTSLLKDHTDTLTAEEFIRVAKKNLSKGATQNSGDKFWDDASTKILTAGMCLISTWKYPDLLALKAFISLDELPQRLRENKDSIPPSIYSNFGQLFAAEGNPKQMSALIATCLQLLDSMTITEFLPSIIGETTVPLKVGPGQMLIIGLNRNYKETLGPLLGALAHTIVEANINEQRDSALAFFCDELPGMYFPKLVNWLNEGREDGFLGILGLQAHSQMVERYGKDITSSIYTGTPTKVFMNPNNSDRAESMSKWVGKVDVEFTTKSDGRSKQGTSRNHAGHKQAIDGMQGTEINRLPQGTAVIVSPGFESRDGKESFIPVKKKINVPENIKKAISYSEKCWNDLMLPELIQSSTARTYGDKDIEIRSQYAEQVLPLSEWIDDQVFEG